MSELMQRKLVQDSVMHSRYYSFRLFTALFGVRHINAFDIKVIRHDRDQDYRNYPKKLPVMQQTKYKVMGYGVIPMIGLYATRNMIPANKAVIPLAVTALLAHVVATIPHNPWYIEHKLNNADSIQIYVEERGRDASRPL